MYEDDLAERVLVSPARAQGYQNLCIVSGYADPDMVSVHLEDWLLDYRVHIQLLAGMFPDKDRSGREVDPERRGIFWINLRGFQALTSYIGANGSTFECRYAVNPPPIHAKLYLWLDRDLNPARAFVGSPNYTQKAFNETRQREVVTSDDYVESCHEFFLKIGRQRPAVTHPALKRGCIVCETVSRLAWRILG